MLVKIENTLAQEFEKEVVDLFCVGVFFFEDEREESFDIEDFAQEVIDLSVGVSVVLFVVLLFFFV